LKYKKSIVFYIHNIRVLPTIWETTELRDSERYYILPRHKTMMLLALC